MAPPRRAARPRRDDPALRSYRRLPTITSTRPAGVLSRVAAGGRVIAFRQRIAPFAVRERAAGDRARPPRPRLQAQIPQGALASRPIVTRLEPPPRNAACAAPPPVPCSGLPMGRPEATSQKLRGPVGAR